MPGQEVEIRGSKFAEVAGGTAAECAVICCCFPCGILNLAILFLYTLPKGICRRMLRKKRRQRLLKKGARAVPRRRSCACGCCCEGEQPGRQVHPSVRKVEKVNDEEKEVMKFEKEMLGTFYSTGFWRSSSQRHS